MPEGIERKILALKRMSTQQIDRQFATLKIIFIQKNFNAFNPQINIRVC